LNECSEQTGGDPKRTLSPSQIFDDVANFIDKHRDALLDFNQKNNYIEIGTRSRPVSPQEHDKLKEGTEVTGYGSSPRSKRRLWKHRQRQVPSVPALIALDQTVVNPGLVADANSTGVSPSSTLAVAHILSEPPTLWICESFEEGVTARGNQIDIYSDAHKCAVRVVAGEPADDIDDDFDIFYDTGTDSANDTDTTQPSRWWCRFVNLTELAVSFRNNMVRSSLINDTVVPLTVQASQDSRMSWFPAQGLLGIYSLPQSGDLWVWVTDTEPVYCLPLPVKVDSSNHSPGLSFSSNSTEHGKNSEADLKFWELRRVTRLHITRVRPNQLSSACNIPWVQHHEQVRRIELEEQRQLRLLRKSLKEHDWYCCLPRYRHRPPPNTNNEPLIWSDVTNSWQRHLLNLNDSQTLPDSRFFWNEDLVGSLANRDMEEDFMKITPRSMLRDWIVPVSSAFVGIQRNVSIGNGTDDTFVYDQIVLSRRSRHRAGTRFTKRGADATGAVANYAETEQILVFRESDGGNRSLEQPPEVSICSYVQTRGSIPLRWSSPTDLKTYRPRVRIGTDPIAQATAVRQHLIDQATHYIAPQFNNPHPAKLPMTTSVSSPEPSLVFVNLVDKKSDQGRLGRALDAVLKAVLDVYEKHPDSRYPWMNTKDIRHVWHDFHALVKKGKWHRLATVLDEIKPVMQCHGYLKALFSPVKGISVSKTQSGVIRTNCMDCLDRTNVVQSLFGRYILMEQLASADRLRAFRLEPQSIAKDILSLPWVSGEDAHRVLWADNADAISRLYAGTAALKGDFTRTGRRTRKGALEDGVNSVQRYYLNNFLDADRQEGIDLVTGHRPFSYIFDDDVTSPVMANAGSFQYRLSLEAAALRLVNGDVNLSMSEGDEDHVRIKEKRLNSGTLDSLDLRWLPGDLQTHVRSYAGLVPDYKSRLVLEELDNRSESELPWWMIPSYQETPGVGDSVEDAQLANSQSLPFPWNGIQSVQHQVLPLVGAILGVQAPLTTAALIVGAYSTVSFLSARGIQDGSDEDPGDDNDEAQSSE
jgi:SacI homology domain